MSIGRKDERGTSMPETAIVLAVLLALIFGIVDFGRAMYTYAFVAQLARQGARWAMVRGSQCTLLSSCPNVTSPQVQTYVQSLSSGATNPGSIGVAASWPTSGCPPGSTGEAPGCTVVVTVTYPFKFMLPWMPSGSLGTISMSSTSEMVISQ